jgi:large subunit ribosomal protein L25
MWLFWRYNMNEFILNAEVRSDLGKGASRRLRRLASLVPAVVYGGEKAPESISMLAKEVAKLLENEAAFSHVIELNIGGAGARQCARAREMSATGPE